MEALSVKNICKRFKTEEGTMEALKGVSIDFAENSTTIIAGANGSGKSVLMHIIARLDEADSGEIAGNESVGLVFQDADTQILGETAREDIAFGVENLFPKDKAEIKRKVNCALEQTGLLEKADYPARFLSGGQKRRLAVAGILAMERKVIIFDEPYANLDYTGVKQVNALICMLQRQRKTVIILTHELEKCLALSSHFVVLYKGEKVFDGLAKDALNEPLESWGIRNPLVKYEKVEDLVWA